MLCGGALAKRPYSDLKSPRESSMWAANGREDREAENPVVGQTGSRERKSEYNARSLRPALLAQDVRDDG
jgi:hypothetical protein